MDDAEGQNKLELFLGCSGLSGGKGLNSFAVVNIKRHGEEQFREMARTETICNSSKPQYCTSIEVKYTRELTEKTLLRIDIYERKTVETEKLSDHMYIAKATRSISDILLATGQHLTVQMSHPFKQEKLGVITISAEEIDLTNDENNSDVHLDVSATILRKRDWNKTILSQRYEIQRSHSDFDGDGHTIWLPIYRSDRITKQHNNHNEIEFSGASLKYRHLCNGDEERRIRLLVFIKAETVKKSAGECLLGICEFSIRDICELDPTEEVLQLESQRKGEYVEIGTVAILKAEPTDFGSRFSLQINHEGSEKYFAGSEERKGPNSRKGFLKIMNRRKGEKQVHSMRNVMIDMDSLFDCDYDSDC